MKFKIMVRKLNSTDASIDCPFPESDDNVYEMHLRALVDDIGNIEGVNSASCSNNEITVDCNFDKSSLKESIKKYFSRELCYIRYLSMEAFADTDSCQGRQ